MWVQEPNLKQIVKPTEKSILDQIQYDFKNGGFRIAAKTIPKTARAILIGFLKSKNVPQAWVKTIQEIMETEWGLALIQQVLAWSFRYLPSLQDDPRAIALADEWGTDSLAIIGGELVNELMMQFAPIISQVLTLTETNQIRFKTDDLSSNDEELEEELVESELIANVG